MKRHSIALILALAMSLLVACGSMNPGGQNVKVDLQTFYDNLAKDYDLSTMVAADNDMLASYYTGLADVKTEQRIVQMCMTNPSPMGDIVLVEVSHPEDVDTVKGILQARIDYMVGDGSASYPESTEMWQTESRIVTNGNYVMLVVGSDCDAIVDRFNALF